MATILSEKPNRSNLHWLQGIVLVCAIVLLPLGIASGQGYDASDRNRNWPQWRGLLANGVSPLGGPPVRWDENTNVKWKVEIPGQGASTPIIWGDQVFVLAAIETGKKSIAEADTWGDGPNVVRSQNLHQFVILCFDRGSGKVKWQKIATEQAPHQGHHSTHGYASASPVTDGRRLFASFGSRVIYCYDLDGYLKWQRDLGDLETRLSYGEGASPALYGETLVVNWDHERDSFIVALDAETGETKWKKERDDQTTWSSPLIVGGDEQVQVIVNGDRRVRSYDLTTGEIIWEWDGLFGTLIPTPVTTDGIVYCMSHTGFGALLYALPLHSFGDITDADKILWRRKQRVQWVLSPLIYGDLT